MLSIANLEVYRILKVVVDLSERCLKAPCCVSDRAARCVRADRSSVQPGRSSVREVPCSRAAALDVR